MATAQKRGFHLPWGGDTRRDQPPPPAGDEDMAPDALAHRLGVALEELGAGPFGLAGSQPGTAEEADEEANESAGGTDAELIDGEFASDAADDEPLGGHRRMTASTLGLEQAAWPTSDRRTAGPLAGVTIRRPSPPNEPAAEQPLEDSEADGAAAVVETDEAAPAAVAPAPTVLRPPQAAAPEPATEAPTAEPSTEARAAREPMPKAPVAETPAPPAQRANPLVVGLVRAMRDAARTARDEAVSGLHADATARAEAIRADSAVAVGELKKAAEADVAAVKEWSRAELARVREETEARIAARRTRLVEETEAAGAAAEDRLASLHAAVEAFEAEMAGFFEALLAENDPARLAGLAERMPTAPGLDAFPVHDESTGAPRVRRSTAAAGARRAAPDKAAPAPVAAPDEQPEPEPAVSMDEPAGDDAGDVALAAEPADDELAAEPAEPAEATDSGSSAAGPLDFLDAQTAAAAEAAALAGLDRRTGLIVSGLASVAAIASFKAALVHLPGVSAVSVTAGANADVLFSVTHDADTDIRDAIRAIESFETHLIADDGDTLSVAARERSA